MEASIESLRVWALIKIYYANFACSGTEATFTENWQAAALFGHSQDHTHSLTRRIANWALPLESIKLKLKADKRTLFDYTFIVRLIKNETERWVPRTVEKVLNCKIQIKVIWTKEGRRDAPKFCFRLLIDAKENSETSK